MSSLTVGLIGFVCAFGGARLGLLLRNHLPEHHLSRDSRDAVMMGTGLIATLTALVLGLLVSSAKNSFDSMNSTMTQSGAKIILLDRTLANYGPQTKSARDLLRRTLTTAVLAIWPEDQRKIADTNTISKDVIGMELVQNEIRRLSPENDSQRAFQAQALNLAGEILQTRWLTIEQAQVSMPLTFIVILFFWVAILFVCIGLFAPANRTVIAVLFVCALSIAGAIFLMREMNRPLQGVMKISSAPLIKALEHIGK